MRRWRGGREDAAWRWHRGGMVVAQSFDLLLMDLSVFPVPSLVYWIVRWWPWSMCSHQCWILPVIGLLSMGVGWVVVESLWVVVGLMMTMPLGDYCLEAFVDAPSPLLRASCNRNPYPCWTRSCGIRTPCSFVKVLSSQIHTQFPLWWLHFDIKVSK